MSKSEQFTKLLESKHGNYNLITFPDEGVAVPIALCTFDTIPDEFVIDSMDDGLAEFLGENKNGTPAWRNKKVTPIAVVGLYTLDEEARDIPDDKDDFQCMGMLFITETGDILRWDGDHYVTDFAKDCAKIGTIDELPEWLTIK